MHKCTLINWPVTTNPHPAPQPQSPPTIRVLAGVTARFQGPRAKTVKEAGASAPGAIFGAPQRVSSLLFVILCNNLSFTNMLFIRL